MASVPSEVLRDVLHPLDRWMLDDVQFTNRRFMLLITERLSDVCLRQVNFACFRGPNEKNENSDGSSYTIRVDDRPERKISHAHEDTAHFFSEFMQALQSSRVETLTLSGFVFTPELAALVLRAPIVIRDLNLIDGSSCGDLTPTEFGKVFLHFSPSSVWLAECRLRACQISDELLLALFKDRMLCKWFSIIAPEDGGSFCVTDDAVVEFCVQEDIEKGAPPRHRSFGQLTLFNGSFTKDLFKRLVEACSMSMCTLPLRIAVSPLSFEEEDLRDYAQHLSYRDRGRPYQIRIYDFPLEQHGAVAAMHLQIALQPDNSLELTRARRPNVFFYRSDE